MKSSIVNIIFLALVSSISRTTSECSGTNCVLARVCLLPRTPENGQIDVRKSKLYIDNSLIETDIIRYKCDDAYKLVGQNTKVCLEDGNWSGATPYCEEVVITCKHQQILNGWVVSRHNGQYHQGDSLRFTCNLGYHALGESERVCLHNGTWSGGPIACKAIDCGSPDIKGGTYTLLQGVTTYPSTLITSCNGHIHWSFCNSAGEWKPPNPCIDGIVDSSSKEPTCPKPPLVIPDTYAVTSDRGPFYTGRTVTYKCDTGYRFINGSTNYLCSGDGTWKPPSVAITCQEIICARPADRLEYGAVSPLGIQSFNLAESIRYFCIDSYRLVGSHLRTCQKDSQWSGQHPQCHRIKCKIPADHLDNGYIKPQNKIIFYYGEKITYVCKKGYMPTGKASRECLKDGTWSGSTVECKSYRKNHIGPGFWNNEGTCGIPPIPDDLDSVDTKDSGPYFSGHKVHYTCAAGYRYQEGSRTYRCTRTGDWWPEKANIVCKESNYLRYSRAGQTQSRGIYSRLGLSASLVFVWMIQE